MTSLYMRGPSRNLSGHPTSMTGPCQEAKSSSDALGKSAGVNSFSSGSACDGLSAVVPRFREPDFHWLVPRLSPSKIAFVFSCQSRNLSTRASGVGALVPSRFNGKTWPDCTPKGILACCVTAL